MTRAARSLFRTIRTLRRGASVAALLAATAGSVATAAPATDAYTNRLIDSSDPYLRMHAHNPVDWYPWGPAAFAKAKAEDKPIFLSIGYSTCYWCHIAEQTIYSNPAIAALMNKWFVNVKVDREAQPDVDGLYIIATEMLTGHGAWPNNLFLTPDLKPFYAGSYFPPTDDGDTPGFPKVLTTIHDLWTNHRADKVEPAAESVMTAFRAIEAKQAAAKAAPVTPGAWLQTAAADLAKSVDPTNGGFGSPASGPKFPQVPALELLLADARLDHDSASRKALEGSLAGMAEGGIDDQLAGGFHRYSTEPTWSLPHFEKSLSDNAQLVGLYAQAYALTQNPQDRAVALATAAYLTRDMAVPGGGFATAQDAETDGVEGGTYIWTRAQIESVLGAADTERFLGVYDVTPLPDQQGGVLRLRRPMDAARVAALAPMRAKLLAARDARLQPARDDKIVTSFNGLAIGGLSRAAIDLGAPELAAPAQAAATRVWATAWDPKAGALAHQIFEGKPSGEGYLDDYAALGDGFLTLADATHDAAWRAKAATLADAIMARFLKPDGTLSDGAGDALPIALGDTEDADAPSGTSAALDLLGRLGTRPDGGKYADADARIATRLAGRIAAHPTMWPSAIVALAEHPPGAAALAAATPEPATRVATAGAATPGVPSTADHVHASAALGSDAAGDTVTVTLKIDPGFHVNAHKPSLDYLIPTDLKFAGLNPSTIAYPRAVTFKPSFAKEGLAVYEGDVALVATFPKGALSGVMGVDATVTTQACNASTCLPPASLPINVPNPG